MDKTTDTYSVNEAAAILGISPDTVRTRIKNETLKAWKRQTGKKEWRIKLDADQVPSVTESPSKGLQEEVTALTSKLAAKDAELSATKTHLLDVQGQLAYARQSRLERLVRAWRNTKA